MEDEIIFNQFNQIEQKVEQLIKVCKDLETENAELKGRLSRLEEDLQAKVAAENNYTRERELIRTRIDGLLLKLGEIAEG